MPFRCSWATVMNTRFTRYGSTFRRHFRLRLHGLETRILPAKGRVEGLPEVLRHAAERGRDQLHLPAASQNRDARKLGERDAYKAHMRITRRYQSARVPPPARPGPPDAAPGPTLWPKWPKICLSRVAWIYMASRGTGRGLALSIVCEWKWVSMRGTVSRRSNSTDGECRK